MIGLSGPICAGKTTSARFLERAGFGYTRFSLVVDDEVARRGLVPTRESRQSVGFDLHNRRGQAYLAERALERVSGVSRIVIDGLRFEADCRFFSNRFGLRFHHLHIIASRTLRLARYAADPDNSVPFAAAEAAPVEAEVGHLAARAQKCISNESSEPDLFESLEKYLRSATYEAERCRSPLS